jgi:hypothetical protein
MITPILENLIVQGLATVNHKTLGQNGVSTISVPENQSIVVTKISIQPFINPSFKDGFGMNNTNQGIANTIEDSIKALFSFNSTDQGSISNVLGQNSNILYEMLKRGTFQIELYSADNNNTIFTFGTDFNFCQVFPTSSDPAIKPLTMLLPALSERSTDCYSVHRNNVHIRLRFLNAAVQNNGFDAPYKSYQAAVASNDLFNTIPETRQNVDINSANLYFNTAVYSNVITGNFGFYPFTVETNLENAGLKALQGNDTITFPYYDANTNVIGSGDGGEASFYSSDHTPIAGANQLRPYMNAFIPYINVEYVLINEKADGGTLVKADRYNKVTVNK